VLWVVTPCRFVEPGTLSFLPLTSRSSQQVLSKYLSLFIVPLTRTIGVKTVTGHSFMSAAPEDRNTALRMTNGFSTTKENNILHVRFEFRTVRWRPEQAICLIHEMMTMMI
jgi:hypothetical protein